MFLKRFFKKQIFLEFYTQLTNALIRNVHRYVITIEIKAFQVLILAQLFSHF